MNNRKLNKMMLDLKFGENVLADIYSETRKVVYAFVLTYVQRKEDAEDVMQETYIRVQSGIAGYNAGNALAWILQIAKNLAINLRYKAKREVAVDYSENEALFGSYGLSEDSVATKALLTKLDRDRSRIVVLHLLAGYKFREISTMLDIPQSTVRWMYGEALKTLKDALEKEEQI